MEGAGNGERTLTACRKHLPLTATLAPAPAPAPAPAVGAVSSINTFIYSLLCPFFPRYLSSFPIFLFLPLPHIQSYCSARVETEVYITFHTLPISVHIPVH